MYIVELWFQKKVAGVINLILRDLGPPGWLGPRRQSGGSFSGLEEGIRYTTRNKPAAKGPRRAGSGPPGEHIAMPGTRTSWVSALV